MDGPDDERTRSFLLDFFDGGALQVPAMVPAGFEGLAFCFLLLAIETGGRFIGRFSPFSNPFDWPSFLVGAFCSSKAKRVDIKVLFLELLGQLQLDASMDGWRPGSSPSLGHMS